MIRVVWLVLPMTSTALFQSTQDLVLCTLRCKSSINCTDHIAPSHTPEYMESTGQIPGINSRESSVSERSGVLFSECSFVDTLTVYTQLW